jgi:2-dehydro-3-deoxyphosphogalactonate aldolase
MTNPLARYLDPMPLIAVLRGITPEEISAVGSALVAQGFAVLEVPLNSPRPFDSIGALVAQFGERCLVGAGTVTTVDEVTRINAAGGRLVVMPHSDTAVIREAKRQRMVCVPGVATPTEAFAALAAGADGLKMFPAEQMPPAVLQAWRAVLPEGTLLVPVGGIDPGRMAAYWEAGAAAFGTGSFVYRPGATVSDVAAAAAAFAAAVRLLPARPSIDRTPPARSGAS